VAAGAFTRRPEVGACRPGRGPQFTDLPAFCACRRHSSPTERTPTCKMELWLPQPSASSRRGADEARQSEPDGLERQVRGTGNGGLGGGQGVNANPLAAGVRADTRRPVTTLHEGDSSYALDHPRDQGLRYSPLHEYVRRRRLIQAYYGTGPNSRHGRGRRGTMPRSAPPSAIRMTTTDRGERACRRISLATRLVRCGSAGDAHRRRELHSARQYPGCTTPPSKRATRSTD